MTLEDHQPFLPQFMYCSHSSLCHHFNIPFLFICLVSFFFLQLESEVRRILVGLDEQNG